MAHPSQEGPFASRDEYVQSLENIIIEMNRQNSHLHHTMHEVAERGDLMATYIRKMVGTATLTDDDRDTVARILKDWDSVRE